eukprot:1156574-Pelagomonas_calceolata.AAC.2
MELGFYPDAATAERRQLSLDGTNRMHVHRMHRMHRDKISTNVQETSAQSKQQMKPWLKG